MIAGVMVAPAGCSKPAIRPGETQQQYQERIEQEAKSIEATTAAASGAAGAFVPQPFGVLLGGVIGVVGTWLAQRRRSSVTRSGTGEPR